MYVKWDTTKIMIEPPIILPNKRNEIDTILANSPIRLSGIMKNMGFEILFDIRLEAFGLDSHIMGNDKPHNSQAQRCVQIFGRFFQVWDDAYPVAKHQKT